MPAMWAPVFSGRMDRPLAGTERGTQRLVRDVDPSSPSLERAGMGEREERRNSPKAVDTRLLPDSAGAGKFCV